ncbi:MAG: hypothetical protein ACFFCO_12435 [Promethearchaeota archaeon]
MIGAEIGRSLYRRRCIYCGHEECPKCTDTKVKRRNRFCCQCKKTGAMQ